MSNTDWNQRIRHEVESIQAEDGPDLSSGCGARDLKGLLHSIVDQITEADRRHSDTLRQMQEKLGNMGQEARAIRSKVPNQFAAAFERIEAGMAELASRVTEGAETVSHHRSDVALPSTAPAQPAEAPVQAWSASAHNTQAEPPKALRSAVDPLAPARKREDEQNARHHAIDTFDVIETSLPGDTSEPWNHDSAEALAGIYDSGDVSFGGKASLSEGGYSSAAGFAPGSSSAGHAHGNVDSAWLQARFDDISTRIDESLAEIRPDQSFFSLVQRLEQFERQFNSAIETVATRADVEGVRLIEAHISEIAEHLENTHGQLVRLDTIEEHLSLIADKINEVHKVALSSDAEGAPEQFHPPVDVHAVAKAAAHETASRFAEMQPRQQSSEGIGEVRGLLERMMLESRQGEENTNALLDTLQQAMIRLLDRVDAMEDAQIRAIQSQPAAHDYAHEPLHIHADARQHGPVAAEATGALNAAVAAVASSRTPSPGNGDTRTGERIGDANALEAARAPEKIRQDFIADARRAKMRLAAENDSTDALPGKADAGDKLASTGATVAAVAPSKPATASKTAAKVKSAGRPILSPRLMVVAIAAVLLGGAYVLWPSSSQTASALKPLPAPAEQGSAKTTKGDKKADTGAPGAAQETAPDGSPTAAPTENATHGEIDPQSDITVGMTTVPFSGVSVDAERPFSAADLQRANRSQAMANMSGKLGQAQANQAIPAAIDMSKDGALMPSASAATGVKNGNMANTALDLPPASVGPLSLRMAAANGDPSAEFEVGARLAEGKGTDQSFKDAAKWYQRSAARGFVQSQYRLGTLYERGLGMKPDLARAEDWYKRAADQGNIKAMHNLAVLSANQTKGTPDYATASHWFTEAAERGLSDSQFNLAVLHENGLGVTQDLKVAYKWLSLAAKSGDKEATHRRDLLKGKLSADDLAAAEGLIATFKAKPAEALANDARTAGEAWKKNPANGVNG